MSRAAAASTGEQRRGAMENFYYFQLIDWRLGGPTVDNRRTGASALA